MLDQQYYILTQSPQLSRILAWIMDNDIPHEIHANRVRFRPHSEQLALQYYLQWSEHCFTVEPPYPSVF